MASAIMSETANEIACENVSENASASKREEAAIFLREIRHPHLVEMSNKPNTNNFLNKKITEE